MVSTLIYFIPEGRVLLGFLSANIVMVTSFYSARSKETIQRSYLDDGMLALMSLLKDMGSKQYSEEES